MKERGEVPDLYIEKLVLGELPDQLRERLLEDPEVRRRVAELQASDREILAAYPAESMARAIRRRAQGRRETQASRLAEPAAATETGRSGLRSLRGLRRLAGRVGRLAGSRPGRAPRARLVPALGFAALVLAAGLVLATRLPTLKRPAAPANQEIRLKGAAPHLVIYRRTASGAETLRERDAVREGDTLQIGFVAAGAGYGLLFSIDGRGALTVHLAEPGGEAARIDGQGELRLPFAYRLDDAPDFERFFFVTSAEPFDGAAVLEPARELAARPAAARTGELALPAGLSQTSLLLLKDE